jgi:radical SAM superfamily enzyme YgiQ (UPF0313 family)
MMKSSIESQQNTGKNKKEKREKILLALLPFWTPLIPPIGIACLKSYLNKRNYETTTVDAAVEMRFKDSYDRYFHLLKEIVPGTRRGNFYSIGHDVLRNHIMADLHYSDKAKYLHLVKELLYKTFYVEMDDRKAAELIEIIDHFYRLLEDYFRGIFERVKPTILGLSVFSDTLPASLFIFKWVRKTYPHVKTVMGGGVFADQLALNSPQLEIFLEKTADFIDKIIIGEGEILFVKWLEGELPASRRVHTLADIDRQVLDLSTADLLDLSDFDLVNYPYNVSYTSRSCPFQCSFCSETIQWGKYRKKAAQQIIVEVRQLIQHYGYQLFLFGDSLLNPLMKTLAQEFLTAKEPVYWSGWLRVDKESGELAHAMKWRRSGFYHARLGIESGSQRVLDMMDKRITAADAKKTIANLAAAGIKTTTLWVVGHPGETEADFQQTLDFLEELKFDIYEAECRPFYYYLTGQAGAPGGWGNQSKPQPLYSRDAEEMLMLQTWILDGEPSREETYRRVRQFTAHCEKLGIPNPYSMHEIYEADERWQKLHSNAVPPLIEFKNSGQWLDECRQVNEQLLYRNKIEIDNFEF